MTVLLPFGPLIAGLERKAFAGSAVQCSAVGADGSWQMFSAMFATYMFVYVYGGSGYLNRFMFAVAPRKTPSSTGCNINTLALWF